MADQIAAGISWLIDQLKANAGQSVTYTRGGTTVGLTAVVQQTAFRTGEGGTGKSKLSWSDCDFTFKAIDLVNAGFTLPPVQTDKISFAPPGAGEAKTYVLYHVPGEKPYKLDPYEYYVTIHAKAQ